MSSDAVEPPISPSAARRFTRYFIVVISMSPLTPAGRLPLARLLIPCDRTAGQCNAVPPGFCTETRLPRRLLTGLIMTARFWGDLKSSDFAALSPERTVAVLP